MKRDLFLIAESQTLTVTEATEACVSLDVVSGSVVTSWLIWRDVGRSTTTGQIHYCSEIYSL